ncbi:protein XRP2-like [Brevipalpus obovatus]|uniref:protein XRP2-like n=1 Tax=Brevipalpus obovatus TaxID=246614 RepID=UPI003D9F6802
MGCWGSKNRESNSLENESSQNYSWNNRPKLDLKEFIIENEHSSVVVKRPGSINGQQFAIQSCKNSTLCIMDGLDSATIDDCQGCTIFLGPAKGSVFIRNCTDCRIMCASQQFRARDCRNLYLFLHCLTKPTIESCESIRVGCYSFFYPALRDQFKDVGLSVFNNLWGLVYDFSTQDGTQTWEYMEKGMEPERIMRSLETDVKDAEISLKSSLSVVPKTLNAPPKNDMETSIVILFPDGNRENRAKAFISGMHDKQCTLIASKEFMMKQVEAEQTFHTDSYNSIVGRGPVIALHHYGPDCIRKSQEVAKTIALETGSTGLVYVSGNQESALQQISLIFNSLDSPDKDFSSRNVSHRPSNAGQII